jgi:Holliday junction resolvase-like predicted endonuclease
MKINKSSRHQKIIGNFGEQFICNWLSRSGFEVIIVDHTGIDLIAYHPGNNHRIGISVKSRTRNENTETSSVNIFTDESDVAKLTNACSYFACEPWLGIYVETTMNGLMYLTSYKNYCQNYRKSKSKTQIWNMTENYLRKYSNDPLVKQVKLIFDQTKWDWK